jgi:hypothetical protein
MLKKIPLTFFLFINLCWGGILNTKHNLSTSGPGSIKGTSEKEVCAFCHIPHGAQPGKPLWNRDMPSSSYTMYSSTYLERSNYPVPTDLGASNDAPGQLSRQCLSCHDGTIAIGGIYAIRGTVLGSALSVSDTNPDGTMKNTATGYIGTDLRIHHPVGFEYDPNVTIAFDSGTKSIELKSTPDNPIKLYTMGGKKYVECASCHDPHSENEKFLRVNVGSHGQNMKQTCTSCHSKDGWTGSAHDTKNNTYSDPAVNVKFGTNTVSDLGCINCHTPHNGQSSGYLLRQVEQNTCFKGASGSVSTAPCHSTGGTKNIENVLSRTYGHGNTLLNQDNVHSNLDVLYGTSVSRFPSGSKGISWDDSKHVECMDCHNQHQSQAGTHSVPSDATNSWYPSSPSNLISASGALKGATGVEPGVVSRWTQPTSFTTMKEATKEYQICMKCHSYWGLGVATDGSSSYATSSEPSINFTDQAWEFNKNNFSGHPVVVNTNSMASDRTIKGLDSGQMKTPWKNVGTQTMMCSDCHGTDNEIGSDPTGPHGSSYKFMLKGENNYWPTNATGTHYRVGQSYGGSDWNGLFCKNCHNIKNGDANAPHNERREMNGLYCVRCHSAVPHGSAMSRLLVYKNWPAPYNYNGNMAVIRGFRESNNYDRDDAWMGSWNPPEAGGGNCNDKHDADSGTGIYENSPY